MLLSPPYQLYASGDQALTIDFGNEVTDETHHRVMSAYHYLTSLTTAGIKDLIPAYTSLTVVYDVLQWKKINPGQHAYTNVTQWLEPLLTAIPEITLQEKNIVSIPVCYDPSLAPDLDILAQRLGMGVEELVNLHTAPVYSVFMLGFLPGFPYMGMVTQRLAAPRHPQPRTHVAAGSVGIAGTQTGIYPLPSPGGWQLIGQTPLILFDRNRIEPCLLLPGDQVRFTAISLSEFQQQKKA